MKTPAVQGQLACSLAYDSNELVLLTKALMTVSSRAKQSMDKMTDKFWEEISQQLEDLVAATNKLKEKNSEYDAIETNQGIESLFNCW